MRETLQWLVLFIGLTGGVLLIPFGLPGTWLIAVGALVFGLLDGWDHYASTLAIGLLIGAAAGEGIEQFISLKGARRYGASRAGVWGSFLGGLIGAIVGVPVALIGSVLGSFMGSFLGAILGEVIAKKQTKDAVQAGWGALLGRVVATGFKLALGFAMAATVLYAVLK